MTGEVVDGEEARAGDRDGERTVARPAHPNVPTVGRPRERSEIQRQLGAGVTEDTSVFCLRGIATRRRCWRDEDDVRRLRAIPRRAEVPFLTEEADVEASLELLRALGVEGARRLGDRRDESALTALGRREAGTLRDIACERRPAERRRREVWLRLLTGLAVRDACLAEGEEARLVRVGKRPRRARLREPAAAILRAERRRPVVAQRRREIQLIEDVERLLAEVRLVMDLVLVVRRRVPRQRVEDAERLRRDESAPDHREGAEISRVEILAERERPAEVLVEMPGRRSGEVVIDLVIGDAPFGDAPQVCRAGAVDRTPLETLVVGDVGA